MHYSETMSTAATIEAINGEQIATRTDLLLMRARSTHGRFSNNKLAFAGDVRWGRGSQSSISVARSLLRAPAPEHTMFIRVRRVSTSTTTAAILAALFATAILLTSFL